MSDNKTYRIKANVGQDSMLNVNLNQNYKTFEILSLKVDSDNLYKFHTSDYGCVAGRVLANGNFGIPNAKISIFIKATDEDLSDAILSYLYPYKNTRIKNEDGVRYNLLPDEQLSDCHRNVGTFPNKRLVLDDNNVFEVYDKYYKYTTRTNNSGDYMIFGVPVGEQTIHVDIDLSDIGILSQRPRDMIYKGYNATQFENANMFKKSTDLDTLTQIISQNSNVYVYPFWGETSEGDVAITRKDIEIQYVFEPTCVFMGSIITDEKSNAISKTCVPSERMGKMDRLTTGSGTIEMIRKKPDGSVEEFIVQGNQLIDGNGVWCYQIPMNLDYVCTDEYGNIVPTDDPKKGIPTRTRVRFRMSITENEDGAQFSHAAKTLVPNNPQASEDLDYVFGSKTLDDEFATKSFRDLFWNKVYSVKSYIPRFQQGNYNRNKRFSGIKEVNVNGSNNPLPYNNMRVDISFMFSLQCAIFHILLKLVTFFNFILGILYSIEKSYSSFKLNMGNELKNRQTPCVFLGDGYCPDLKGWYFAPGCNKDGLYNSTFSRIQEDKNNSNDTESIEYENSEDEKVCLTRNIQYFTQCTEINMAMEYDVIQFDFYNDWVNGVIYSPRWNADMRKKRSYLFGAIRVSPRLNACSEENFTSTRRLVQQCAMQYSYDNSTSGFTTNKTSNGCVEGKDKQRCHKAKGRKWVKIFGGNGGVVHRELTSTDSSVYYYKPFEWRNNIKHPLFATDIILLGSLNENDEQGIPQTFTKLLSSTYQLPDALASTNIGAEGFLYGYSGGGALCNRSIKDEGVTIHKVEGNFSGLVEWSKGSEEYEANPYDDPKPITESAGIDWGFSGPEQGENKFDSLYYPGGHFLGISCTWSEVNVKSCVNLSRICELGSTISHRKSFMVNEGDDSYRYIDSVPSGLISGDELLDYSGKNEFATLNYNGLITRRNKENNLLEYDFKTIIPINFSGELKEKISGKTEYKKTIDDSTFIRTVEEASTDYYRFRMGFNGAETKDEQKTHFLSNVGENVTMPVYKNSFYFYFGISNGNTALDRFNKEFFAECPKFNAYTPEVDITTDSGAVCEFNSAGQFKGSINIVTKSVDNPRYKITGGGYNITNGILYNNVKKSIDAYTGNEYNVTVYGDNIIGVNKKITLEVKIPERLSDVKCDVKDFEKGFVYNTANFANECDTAKTGYVSITIPHNENITQNAVAVLITSGKKYHYVLGDSSYGLPNEFTSSYTSVSYGSLSGGLTKCYLWEGNTSYDVYVRVFCGTVDGERVISPWFKCTNFFVGMPEVSDIIFHGNNDASYQKVLKKYLSGYVNSLFDNSAITEDVRNSFKQALYFRESKYDAYATESLDIEVRMPLDTEPTYFLSRDTIDNVGGETFLEYGDRIKGNYSDLQAVYVPNRLLPRQTIYEGYLFDILTDDYEELLLSRQIGIYGGRGRLMINYASPYYDGYKIEHSGYGREINTKKTYVIDLEGRPIDDLDGAFLSGVASFQVPYFPFFFKALFVIDNENVLTSSNSSYVNISIANGIKKSTRHDEYKTIEVCGYSLKNVLTTEKIDYSELTGSSFNTYKDSFCLEDMYPIDTANKAMTFSNIGRGEYSVKIEEHDGRTLSDDIIVRFIGDKYGTGANDYYSYEEGEGKVVYHKIAKDNLNGLRFTSYFLRDLGGRNNKKLISNKGKYFTADSGETQITSPFFPGWDIGTLGMMPSLQYVKNKGGDYAQAMAWPKYGSTYAMWTSWYFCGLPNTIISEETLRGGDISGSDDEFVIIGVYDEQYNGYEDNFDGRGLFSNPMASKITIIKVYSVSTFNDLKRKIGLTTSN